MICYPKNQKEIKKEKSRFGNAKPFPKQTLIEGRISFSPGYDS
jgi:hypothetical protein